MNKPAFRKNGWKYPAGYAILWFTMDIIRGKSDGWREEVGLSEKNKDRRDVSANLQAFIGPGIL
jgi:hypothetical protein